MPYVPQELKDRLKREVSVQRLAEARGIKLRRAGKELIGLCPFHDDRNPSLAIDPAKNEWHCKGNQLTLTYDRKRIILERNATSEDLGGKYVDVYDFPDGRLEVRSSGLLLPYSIFSKDQRVSHTAIVENKRLGHALALIKAQQDKHFEAKVKNNSEKGAYQKRGRQIYGPDYVSKAPVHSARPAEPVTKTA